MKAKKTIMFAIAIIIITAVDVVGHPCEPRNSRETPERVVKKDKLDRLPDKHKWLRGLNLTEEQKIELRDIKNGYRERVKMLRSRTEDAMMNVLTEEQQKELKEKIEKPRPLRDDRQKPRGDVPEISKQQRQVGKSVVGEETWGDIKNKF